MQGWWRGVGVVGSGEGVGCAKLGGGEASSGIRSAGGGLPALRFSPGSLGFVQVVKNGHQNKQGENPAAELGQGCVDERRVPCSRSSGGVRNLEHGLVWRLRRVHNWYKGYMILLRGPNSHLAGRCRSPGGGAFGERSAREDSRRL
jgi:hypothetical protein